MLEAAATDEAALLTECRKEERSLQQIERLVGSLKSQPLPSKTKKDIAADWMLEYASDAVAVGCITCGDVGPFAVIEGVMQRFLPGSEVESIEVLRQFGPFGNLKRSLNGRWSTEKLGKGKNAEGEIIRWRYSYQIDGSGRERDVPKKVVGTQEAQLAYLSPSMLIINVPTNSESILVFSRIKSLDQVLIDLRVMPPPELEPKSD